jgi:hypothetical protein
MSPGYYCVDVAQLRRSREERPHDQLLPPPTVPFSYARVLRFGDSLRYAMVWSHFPVLSRNYYLSWTSP